MSIINYRKCKKCNTIFLAYDRETICNNCESGVSGNIDVSKTSEKSSSLFSHAKYILFKNAKNVSDFVKYIG